MTKANETICQEADRLVSGDRQKDYGHPLDGFTHTAALWTAFLGERLTTPITAEEVPTMQILLKVSREANAAKRDNRVDMCGYAKCVDMIIEERDRRGLSSSTG